ncbi:probable methyltransferase-like protein 24 [Ptychodera flava]|uniref:probable methyltransferase-like protein 24 n=1 Tax=Ptychodera flava TaxID=63121 RepID=UPI00396A9E6E
MSASYCYYRIVFLVVLAVVLFFLLRYDKTKEIGFRYQAEHKVIQANLYKVEQGEYHGIDREVEAVLTDEQSIGLLMKAVTTAKYNCSDNRRMGHPIPRDGGWNVCMDVGINPKECIVYSIGIANNWSFDDDFADYGCQVYSFDPYNGMSEHRRSERIYFYNIGLCDNNNDTFKHRKETIKCRTLESIRKMLNHEQKDIDVVKFDIEGDELRCLPEILSSGILNRVKLLDFELHVFTIERYGFNALDVLKLVRTLEHEHGFLLWFEHENEYRKLVDYGPYAGNHSDCLELAYINTKFLTNDTSI